MAGKNSSKTLSDAKAAKKDEFYTQMDDIVAEMRYHRKQFKGKTVFCNCDDPFESNFFKYFALNFNKLGLKKLIATCYATSPFMYTQLSLFGDDEPVGYIDEAKKPYKIEITEVIDENGDGAIDITDVEYLLKSHKNALTILKGDGDFRSPECIELLNEADIVVTNPPFSLWIPYMKMLIDSRKKFLVLGNLTAVTYRDIFPHIMNNEIWLGQSIHSGDREFRVPDSYPIEATGYRVGPNGEKYIRVKGVRWYTNLDTPQRHEELDLYKKYDPAYYKKFYNYDAINVDNVSEIPRDYYGKMGVPISFIDVYNPDQFEIIGNGTTVPKTMQHTVVGDEIQYIKDGVTVWKTPYTVSERKVGNSLRIDDDGKPGSIPFGRIIIRRKDNGD